MFPPRLTYCNVLDDRHSLYISKPDVSSKINILYKDVMYASMGSKGSIPQGGSGKLLEVEKLTLQTPRSSNILITDFSLEIYNGDHLLVMGPSGSGKTSLLRALAGLWNTGEASIFFDLSAEEKEKFASDDRSKLLRYRANPKDGISRAIDILKLYARPLK
ncbi:uncharacterized protein A4U43_C06F11520 [Asparagus officinalis]|uniref:ABC transporter domain-containing protein n=1 Tax=Asparagus officinalis TaxID=4686 RepID=A0A5P1ELF9_ASPOF|nr:uncharacterized protein A4U43_C06F11520 [Asparagus officinalis]